MASRVNVGALRAENAIKDAEIAWLRLDAKLVLAVAAVAVTIVIMNGMALGGYLSSVELCSINCGGIGLLALGLIVRTAWERGSPMDKALGAMFSGIALLILSGFIVANGLCFAGSMDMHTVCWIMIGSPLSAISVGLGIAMVDRFKAFHQNIEFRLQGQRINEAKIAAEESRLAAEERARVHAHEKPHRVEELQRLGNTYYQAWMASSNIKGEKLDSYLKGIQEKLKDPFDRKAAEFRDLYGEEAYREVVTPIEFNLRRAEVGNCIIRFFDHEKQDETNPEYHELLRLKEAFIADFGGDGEKAYTQHYHLRELVAAMHRFVETELTGPDNPHLARLRALIEACKAKHGEDFYNGCIEIYNREAEEKGKPPRGHFNV